LSLGSRQVLAINLPLSFLPLGFEWFLPYYFTLLAEKE